MASPKMSTAMKEYLAGLEARRRSPATVAGARVVLTRMIRDVGDFQMANLKPEHIERWFYGPKGLMAQHKTLVHGGKKMDAIAPSTHNQYRTRLKTFFDWAAKRGYMKRDVLENVAPLKVHAKPRQRPAPHVLLGLLDLAEIPRDRAWLATAINTALRSNELCGIKVGDVDLESGYISVTIPKTGDVDEQPITSDLDVELRRWFKAYSDEIGRPLESDDYLFPNRTTGHIRGSRMVEGKRQIIMAPVDLIPKKPITRSETVVKKVLDSLGMATRYEGTHTIRRAVALAYFDSVSKEQGDVAALRETAALLHHKNIATTEIYLGMTAEKNRRDRRMKGKPFLSALVEVENVVPLKAVGADD